MANIKSSYAEADLFNQPLAVDLDERAKQITELYPQYSGFCYSVAQSILGNPEDAEEVVQDVFVRVATTTHPFRGDNGSSFRTWLSQIVHDCARNRYRDNNHEISCCNPRNITDSLDERELPLYAQTRNPQREYENKELEGVVLDALTRLSQFYREPLVLFAVKGLSYDHIGRRLGCNLGIVKSRMNKARVKLRKKLGTDYKG